MHVRFPDLYRKRQGIHTFLSEDGNGPHGEGGAFLERLYSILQQLVYFPYTLPFPTIQEDWSCRNSPVESSPYAQRLKSQEKRRSRLLKLEDWYIGSCLDGHQTGVHAKYGSYFGDDSGEQKIRAPIQQAPIYC